MKKTTKGALAVSAAGVLLLGGAGTLSYWTDTATVTGGSLSAGELDLEQVSCDSDWMLDGAGGAGGALAGRLLVPGDTVTKTCEYTLTATGDHLELDLAVNGPGGWVGLGGPGTPSGDFAAALDYSAEFLLVGGGHLGAPLDSTGLDLTEGTYTVDAVITAEVPFDANPVAPGNQVDNSFQGGTAHLDDFTVVATQVDSH